MRRMGAFRIGEESEDGKTEAPWRFRSIRFVSVRSVALFWLQCDMQPEDVFSFCLPAAVVCRVRFINRLAFWRSEVRAGGTIDARDILMRSDYISGEGRE